MLKNKFWRMVMCLSILSGVWGAGLPARALPLAERDATAVSAVPAKAALADAPEVAPTYHTYLPLMRNSTVEASWPMAGANPQRTSWTPTEVRGQLKPQWYKIFDAYIPPRVQLIAANGLIYVATARGLYALDAASGAQRWVFPTALPLGNSPTIVGDVAYVGGFDGNLYALGALDGQLRWAFKAGAGFDTNPLVMNGLVYAGNRDGRMYAVYADDQTRRGTLAWSYQTAGPIHFSAAYNDGQIYFASDDSYAYALNAATGDLVWKSAKLPGAGFHSWWPVVVQNVVIFSASRNYRFLTPPQTNFGQDAYTNGDDVQYAGTGWDAPLGARLPDGRMDATNALNYLEAYPWRRSFFVLNASTGQEVTYDFNHNGQPEYAPLLYMGTHSGNQSPAVVGRDGFIYTYNHYLQHWGQAAGWELGSSSLKTPSSKKIAFDEPMAISAGGNVIYWNHCCDRSAGAFDINGGQDWTYFEYNLSSLIPGYGAAYAGTAEANAVSVYGGWNGVYGLHGDQNAPIPYNGKVYMHRKNAVIAFSAAGGAQALPRATITPVNPAPPAVDTNALKQRLADEVQAIIAAGHLRPGYGAEGQFSMHGLHEVGDHLSDYWSNPSDTLLVLSAALPYLPANLQTSLKTYLQSEFNAYKPYDYTHIGWKTGAAREPYDLPPEVQADLNNWPATMWSTYDFPGYTGPDWKWPPQTFYALWKYAQVFGNAQAIFNASKGRLWSPPSDATLALYPFAHNAYIAGYWGYLELQKLAGYPEDSAKRATLDRLLALRASAFNKDNPWGPDAHNYGQCFSVARNFVNMTPELADYLRANALTKVQAAINEYESVAPYWFVTRFEATCMEDTMHHLYDYAGLFAAHALILRDNRETLAQYLDVPAFPRGDLFYIQNLIYTLNAPSGQ